MFADSSEILNRLREERVFKASGDDLKLVNDPAELDYLGQLAEITLFQGALGLLTETTIDRTEKGTSVKTKNIAPDIKFLMEVLRVSIPDKYGKSADDGKTNVNIWAAELMKAEDLLAAAKNIDPATPAVAVE